MLTPNLVKIGQLGQELNLVETHIHTETKWRSHRDKMAISHRDKMAISGFCSSKWRKWTWANHTL